ncbi:MAG TPA: PE-PPE domain-containing protein [Mycobacterium sp.]|nr:PE-PPE domain-containing protein [Mycobacterium sp.]
MEFALRPYATAAIALAGASLIAVNPVALPALDIQVRAVQLAAGDDIGLVIGGSGTPIPGTAYVDAANALYIHSHFPDTIYPGVLANGLFTPEGLYPLTGVKTLPFNYPSDPTSTPIAGFPSQSTSVGQGVTILDNNIQANIADHNTTTVFGYSQSATISSLEMQQLAADHVPTSDVNFVLIGDPSAPNGGLLERFNGFENSAGAHALPLNLPSLGLSFDGATPDEPYQTAIYSMEYDGFADFPRYPLNLLADLNAFLGIQTLHGTYLNGGVNGSGPTATDIANAKLLPGSEHAETDACVSCTTDYYMIDTLGGQQITPPLVSLLGGIPLIGKPVEELFGPALTYLINLGYGDGAQGWSDTAANVATPFGLFPDVTLGQFFQGLFAALGEGFHNLITAAPVQALSLFDGASDAAAAAGQASATAFTSLSDFVNALSGAASSLYSALLPTADIVNALVSSVPQYDISLIFDNLFSGHLIDAIGLPIAANMALFTLAAGFELEVITDAIKGAISAF